MGSFLNRFTGKNQFLFHESKLFYHGIQYSKNTPINVVKYVKSWKLPPFWSNPL